MASINNLLVSAAEPILVSSGPRAQACANSLLTRASYLAQLPLTPLWSALQIIASTCIMALSCVTLGQVKWLYRKSEAIHSSRIGAQHLIAAPVFKALGVIRPAFCTIHNNGMEVFDLQENGLLTHNVQKIFNLIIIISLQFGPRTYGLLPHILGRITALFALVIIPIVRVIDLVIGLGALVVTIITCGQFPEVNKVAYRGLQITGIIGDLFWAINLLISPYSVASLACGISLLGESATQVISTKESIANYPLFHLKRLTANLQGHSKVSASFLEQNLKSGIGIGPGPSQEYLTDLTLALTRTYSDLFNSTGAHLASDQELDLNGKYTSESEARLVCYRLGELFAWARRTRRPLGDSFSPLLFKILREMSEQEVTTPLETGSYLSPKALTALEELMYPRLCNEPVYKQIRAFLRLQAQAYDSERKEGESRDTLLNILFPDNPYNAETSILTIEQLRQQYQRFREGLIMILFPETYDEHPNLSNEELNPLLIVHLRKTFARQARSIQYIAQGMKGKAFWNLEDTAPSDLAESIQGVNAVDREAIIDLIRGDQTDYLEVQVQWLKEWLRDGATRDDEVRLFIRFIAGSSALKREMGITIAGIGTILPNAHSCSQTLDLPRQPMSSGPRSNKTKPEFINLMKYVIEQPLNYGSP